MHVGACDNALYYLLVITANQHNHLALLTNVTKTPSTLALFCCVYTLLRTSE